MRLLLCVLGFLTVMVGLTGCGSTGSEESATYVGTEPGTAVLVQWTASPDGALNGSVRLTRPAVGGDDLVANDSMSLSGRRSGSSVSLTVDYGLGLTETWAGAIEGAALILDVPQDDGTLQELRLSGSDVGTYNAAVQDITAAAATERDSVVAAQAELENEQAAERAASDARNREVETQTQQQEAYEAVVNAGAQLTARGDLQDLVDAVRSSFASHEQSLAVAEAAACQDRGDPVTAVGDAYTVFLDDVSSVTTMVDVVRGHADEVDADVAWADEAGVEKDLAPFLDEAGEARSVADSAEQEVAQLDEAAIATNDAAYALDFC